MAADAIRAAMIPTISAGGETAMPKPTLQCQVCKIALDKTQAQFVDEDTFAFLSHLPPGVSLGSYCFACFDQHVESELSGYNAKMELAKNINIFYLTQSKESRFVRRIEKPVKVENCLDRNELILRLAFRAVEANKNSLVDVDLLSTKIRNGRWQTSRWSGRGIPASIDEVHLKRRSIYSE